jgi:methionyl-tRNA formyltransferase
MIDKNSPKIVIAGSVNSSKKTLGKLIEHGMNISGVLALSPEASVNVSGYQDLGKFAEENGLPYKYFEKINSDSVVKFVKDCAPDYMFVVGLSQLVKKPLLDLPKEFSIGFHPTKLPKGRGRAAVAWLILGKAPGAATFFRMSEGMDDGPILAQEEFNVSDDAYAQDVINQIVDKVGVCLDRFLPEIKKGKPKGMPQEHTKATYLGKRNPGDGLIDWSMTSNSILRLIRALSDPLPGAFTYYNDEKVIIKRAKIEPIERYVGVIGGILENEKNGVLIQTGDGLIRCTQIEGVPAGDLRVGLKLGMDYAARIDQLKKEITELNQKIVK